LSQQVAPGSQHSLPPQIVPVASQQSPIAGLMQSRSSELGVRRPQQMALALSAGLPQQFVQQDPPPGLSLPQHTSPSPLQHWPTAPGQKTRQQSSLVRQAFSQLV
jgi:hypothetical protein